MFTGQLGTASSQLGNVELGLGSAAAPPPPVVFMSAFDTPIAGNPVRRGPSRAPYVPLQSPIAGTALTLTENISLDKWYTPFALPRWQRRPLLPLPPLHAELVSNPGDFPPDPAAFQMRAWEVPLSLPVRPKFNSAPWQRFHYLTLDAGMVAEHVFWDALAEGMGGVPHLRSLGRRKDTHSYRCGFLVLDTSQLAETVFEPALESMRMRPWGRPPMRGNGRGVLQLDQGQMPETVISGEWWTDLARPTPRRPWPRLPWLLGIGEHYDQDLFAVPFVLYYRWRMLTGGLE